MFPDSPVFPIIMIWHATGESEEFEDERDFLVNLEAFDTASDSDEATAKDAHGRVVRLRVDIMRGSVDVELAER